MTATASLDRPAKAIKQGTKRVFVVGSRESVRRVRAVESRQVDRVWTMHRLGRPGRSLPFTDMLGTRCKLLWDLGCAASPPGEPVGPVGTESV